MTIIYRIDKERGISLVLWDRTVTGNEFLAHVRRLIADADWPPYHARHLSDLRTAVLDASLDEATLSKAARLYGQHPKITSVKSAIIASESFKKALTFERFISHSVASIIVFYNLETACKWLGIDAITTSSALQALRETARNNS